jgi:hypothetical protein
MHSWLRQAIALTVRLGCPLQQIIYRHLVNPVNWQEQRHLRYPGFDVNQAQVRLIWLGQTVNASYPYAVGHVSGDEYQLPFLQAWCCCYWDLQPDCITRVVPLDCIFIDHP